LSQNQDVYKIFKTYKRSLRDFALGLVAFQIFVFRMFFFGKILYPEIKKLRVTRTWERQEA